MTYSFSKSLQPSRAFHFACALVTLSLAIIITIKSLGPAGDTQTLPHLDKVMHFCAYFGLSLFASLSLPPAKLRRWAAVIILSGIAYGGIMEGFQYAMMAGRTASFLDALANSAGALCGTGLALLGYNKGFLRRDETVSRGEGN